MTAPQTVPVPPEFSFEWDSPEEAAAMWAADLMHWPRGLSLLSSTMDMPAFGRGASKAVETLRMPMKDLKFKYIRGYVYNSFTPYSFDPAEMEKRAQEMQETMMEHVPGLYQRWQTEYEPEVRSINDDTLHGDYSKLGDKDLAELIEMLIAKREREGELHFLAVFPAGGAVMAFEQVYEQLFGAPKGGEHLQLLQGFDNKSTETDTSLWRLAMEARKRPAVLDVLRGVDASAAHETLGKDDQTRPFRDAVDEFLNACGWRGADLDVASKTWKEDPTTAYKLIREYASRDDYNPEDEFKSLVAARQAREKLLIDKLGGDEQRVGMFKMMLGGAQQYLPVQEDHNFWIDQQGIAVQRVPVLEAARRFVAAKRLADVEDVFFLTYDELQDALRNGNGSFIDLVAQRKREQIENRNLTPPPVLGTLPPPEVEENPMLAKFFGAIPPESADPRVINGNGASAGAYTGTARVIMTLDDADRLQSGEVLVCPATMPPWTPLFGIASAVVTDHGGILSHTAIVAREYRIPAVIGTKVATSLVRDGQTVTVDGDAGTVRLED